MTEAAEKQLDEWVKGNPVHNDTDGECTPDFSCCRGEGFLAPQEVRERFAKAHREGDAETKMKMLGMFLCGAVGDKQVYVAGTGDDDAGSA